MFIICCHERDFPPSAFKSNKYRRPSVGMAE